MKFQLVSCFVAVAVLSGGAVQAASPLSEIIAAKQYTVRKAVLPESRISPDKRPGALSGGQLSFLKDLPTPGNCLVVCSPGCIETANQIQSRCQNGGGGGDAGCTDTMSTFFSQRQSTTRDQDRTDAVQYCISGASTSCPTLTIAYASKRRSTTKDNDVNDSTDYCRRGGMPECLDRIYPELSRRTGTTADQDVNDALRMCTGG